LKIKLNYFSTIESTRFEKSIWKIVDESNSFNFYWFQVREMLVCMDIICRLSQSLPCWSEGEG